jgi:hypothetical protein
MPPTYIYPDRPVKYHGAGMTKALKKLRDKNPYEEAKTASDPRFWAKFQQDYYAMVIIKKPKSLIRHNMWIGSTWLERVT